MPFSYKKCGNCIEYVDIFFLLSLNLKLNQYSGNIWWNICYIKLFKYTLNFKLLQRMSFDLIVEDSTPSNRL